MVYRIQSGLFGTATTGAILCLLCFLFRAPTAEPMVVVEEPNLVLKNLVPERDFEVKFRVYNRSGRIVRVVGIGLT